MNQEKSTEQMLQELIADVEENGMLHAPVEFKRHVMEKTRRPDVQLVVQTQKLSRGMELFFYSLKIGVAAVMALLFLLWMPQDLTASEFSLTAEPPAMKRENGLTIEQMTIKQDNTFSTERSAEPEKTLSEKMDQTVTEVTNRITKFANEWINKEDENHD